MNDFSIIHERYPFLTLMLHQKINPMVGVVQLQATKFTTVYQLDSIPDPAQKQKFLELCEIWWFESNRIIPISIFLQDEMEEFRYALRTFPTRELKILVGPCVNLSSYVRKRIKKKSIRLV